MKQEKRFGYKEIALRRLQYMISVYIKKNFYDRQQRCRREYDRCLSHRRIRQSGKTEHIKKKILGEDRFVISRIAVSVTNQCSLNCRDCNNLMPYCKEKFTIDVKEQIKDLQKLLEYVDGIINVEVIGGEPFVYRQLPELLQYLCAEPKIHFIEITSNGTIIPSGEVLDLLRHSKICVLLSDYGKVNSEKAKKTYQWLRQHQVCSQNLKNREWISTGNIDRRRKSKWRMKYEYFHCDARKDCRTLYKGKLYVCGRAPVLDELGVLRDDSSFLDIRQMSPNVKIGREQLHSFWGNDYAECCLYCDYASDHSRWIESGIQQKRGV